MSDNLIIREDGIGRLIRGVDALEIKLQGGGTSRWVRFNPRDQKSVNENGEYHAKDDGVDGYRTITVNVPTRTKSQEPGRDQEIFNPDTGTGYYTDDNGYLHEEVVPDEIRIMHVPDKTTYQDGEPIDLEGIVVQAYRDGEVWTSEQYPDGYIPAHELTASKGTQRYTTSDYLIDNGATEPLPVYSGGSYDGLVTARYKGQIVYSNLSWVPEGALWVPVDLFDRSSDYVGMYIVCASKEPGAILKATGKDFTTEFYRESPISWELSDSFLKKHAEGYFFSTWWQPGGYEIKTNVQPWFIPTDFKKYTPYYGIGYTVPCCFIAYTLLYGTQEMYDGIVSWARPKDGKILSANFYITMEDSP